MQTIYPSVLQMKKMLGHLDVWLQKAAGFAKAKGFDDKVYLSLRLAPDQFSFDRQVQIACDSAKFCAARLSGKDAPSHADTEQTLDELRARVQKVIAYLDEFDAKDFAGADERILSLPRWEGKSMTAANYFIEHGTPTFYFHVTHAYAILRHNGVDLGKKDYLGQLGFRPA